MFRFRGAFAKNHVVRVLSVVGLLAGLIVTTSTVVPVAAASGSAYTPQSPNRILDTRVTGGTLGTNASLNLTVAGGTTGVPAGATGVVLNVTVTNTTTSGALTVYPAGGTRPVASNLNWVAGETRPNLVNVPVGTAGQVTIYNFVGSTDIVVDEEGYFAAPSGTAGGYNPLTPARLLDTRLSAQTMNTGTSIDLQVTGAGGVPATGVSAVVLNATATNTATEGFFTLFPQGTTRPLASNVNWKAGWTIPNRVIVKVGATGKVTIYNGQGSADAVMDVSGYFTDATASGRLFTPVFPVRVLDTRITGGTIGPNGTFNNFQVTGTFTVPPGATAAFLNTTVTNTSASSALTVYPNARPLASDLNWVAGQTIPNLTLATLSSSGGTNFYNFVGSTDLVLDLSGYFGAVAGVTVTANPASIPADGATTSTVTATVINANGSPALNDSVNFTKSGGAACGAIGGPATTNASGAATVTYTASLTAGTCTITATEAQGGLSGTTTITQTALPNTFFVLTATPSSIPADGTSTSAINSTVHNGAGAGVVGDVVSYTLSGNPAAACGTLSASSATTGAGGVSPAVTYTASITNGFCTLTATESGTGSSKAIVITQHGTATNLTAVTASPTGPFPADGAKTSTITATVTGNGIANDLVAFTMTPSVAGACGTLSAASATTNVGGAASVTYTVSTTAGTCTIKASEANGGSSNTVVITQTGVPNNIALTATPSSIPADGAATSTLRAMVTKGVGGAAVAGDVVTFGRGGPCGPISSPTATTDASGLASVTYTASTTVGFCTITASDGSGGTGGPITITQTSTAASAVAVAANPTSVPADNVSTSIVTATVTSSGGGPVPNDSVNFTTSGGSACGTFTTANPINTNGAGAATVTYKASTTVGTCTITATEATLGKTGSTIITQTTVVNTITVTDSVNPIPADGTTTSLIQSHVSNTVSGNVGGDVVTYTMSANPAGACGTLSAPTATTAAGTGLTPNVTYTSSLVVGFCTLTATEAGTGQSTSVVITEKSTAANSITVGVSPASVPADGATTSTVTATVLGTGHANDLVAFTLTPSVAGACGTLSAASATTNVGGTAAVTYTASTKAGTCVVNVAEANGGSNNSGQAVGTKTITQTAVPNNIALAANPSSIRGDGSSTSVVTATVTKGIGGAVSGDTVNFTVVGANCGTLSAASAVTDAAGHAIVTYTSKLAPGTFCTVHAVDVSAGSPSADVVITQTA